MWVTGEYFDGFRAAELAARGRLDAAEDPQARLGWFKRVWQQAPPGRSALISRARAGQAEAWLFLARTRPGRAVALAAPHGSRFMPLFVGDPEPSLQRALLRATARRLRNFGIARITLAPLLPEHAGLLAFAFSRGGWIVTDRLAGANFLLNARGRNFDEIWDIASPELHERVAAGARHMHVEVSDLLTPQLWDEVELLAGPNSLLQDLAQDATLDRSLRLGVARIGDAPVAAELWSVTGGSAFCHWRGADPTARDLFPADQLLAATLRYLINVDRAELIDLGNGCEAELADWADDRRLLRQLELFNPRAPSAWGPALAARTAALLRRTPID